MNELQGKTRAELAKIWKSRIAVAQQRHKEKVQTWADKVIKEYTGDVKSDLDTGEKYEQVAQVIMSVEETIQPHLFFQNPRMIASTNRKNSPWEKRVELVEEVVNHQYKDLKSTGYGIELENELALLDARILGYGATITSYEVEGDYLDDEAPQNMMDRMKNFITGEQQMVNRVPVITKEVGQVTEHVSSLDIYLDPTAKHITKQTYVIRKMDVSLGKLKNHRYDQDKVNNLKPTILNMPDMHQMSDEERKRAAESNPDFNGFRIYEIHDLENRLIHTMVDGYEDFIEFGTEYFIKEGCSITFLWFIDGVNDVYPLPPIKFYRKRALEFSYVYSKLAENVDKFMPKIGYDINRLDEPEKQKFRKGIMGSMFATNGPPEGALKVFTSEGNMGSLIQYLAAVKELLNLESASNEYELASPEKRKATEARQIQEGTTARRFKPKKRVAGFIKAQAHTIWQTLRDNASFDKFAEILGEEEAREWWNDPQTGKASWELDTVTGDFAFDFDMDAMAPKDLEQDKRESAEQLTTALRPDLRESLLADGKRLKITPIFEKFASKVLGVKDISIILEDITIPEAGQEHNAWMNGQFPEISQAEAQNPEKLMKHFQEHKAFIDSPAFRYLPPQIQQGALMHLGSYKPLLDRLQVAQGNSQPNLKGPQSNETREQKAELVA